MQQSATYTTGSVTSTDGGIIGYKQAGKGPGLILVHGGMMASQNFEQLGRHLANDFTVYIPDRRGRGASKTNIKEYGLQREAEDIQAIAKQTGTQNIFGLSSGAIITMQTALIEPSVKKIAIYEPPLPFTNKPLLWAQAYDSAMKAGNYGAAMASVLKGTGDRDMFMLMPAFILAPLFNLAIKDEDKKQAGDKVPLKELIASMYYDIKVVEDAKAILEKYNQITAKVLLLGGTKSNRFLTDVVNILQNQLPAAERITFKGVGHIAADNNGKPGMVADALKIYFNTQH